MKQITLELPHLEEGVEAEKIIEGKKYIFKLVAIEDKIMIDDSDEMSLEEFNVKSVFDEDDDADEFSEKVQKVLKDITL